MCPAPGSRRRCAAQRQRPWTHANVSKKVLTSLLLAAALVNRCERKVAHDSTPAPPSADETVLLKVDEEFVRAMQDPNPAALATLGRLAAPDMVDAMHVPPKSRMEWLAMQRNARARKPPATPLPYRLEQINAVVHGTFGLVTREEVYEPRAPLRGEPRLYREEWCHIWRKEQTGWHLVYRIACRSGNG